MTLALSDSLHQDHLAIVIMEMGSFLTGLWELHEFESLLIWATELDPLPKNSITKSVLCAITNLHHKIGNLRWIDQDKPLTDPKDEESEDIKPVIAVPLSILTVVIELDNTPVPESKAVPPPVVPAVADETPMPTVTADVEKNEPLTPLPTVEPKTDETPAPDPTPVVAHNSHRKEKKEETEEELGPWVSLVIKVRQMKFLSLI